MSFMEGYNASVTWLDALYLSMVFYITKAEFIKLKTHLDY
jgi:hypothetical protein